MLSIYLARFFLSALFTYSASSQLLHWHETETLVMNALCDWQSYMGFSQSAQDCLVALMPWSSVLVIVAIILEFSGGLMVLLGIRERFGAGLLLLFFIPATLLFHAFWFLEGSARELQAAMFCKNLAICGGLILIALNGAQIKDSPDHSGGGMGF